MRAHQHFVLAFEKRPERLDFASIIRAGRIAEIPSGFDMPIGPEAELGQWLVVEARADGFLGHDDDRLLESLIVELVESDEHRRAALAPLPLF
jgi:hypothetical protein